MIDRYLTPQVQTTLDEGLVAILYGARQTGKTTLAKHILQAATKSLYLDCDDPAVRLRLSDQPLTALKALLGDAELVVIDEAQRVANIGLTAKLIHDNMPRKKLLLTGSSSLDLANKIKEPLTGRSRELLLYPLALKEVANTLPEADGYLPRMLVYGGYPGLWRVTEEAAAARARDIANNYLYRDAFALGTVYDTTVMDTLLRLLAYQVGSEVSYSELASNLEVSKQTVMRYVDLLEKAFVVFRLPQFRKNLRVQVGRLRKIYFYDLGMRNALIDDFKPLELRGDVGALWENFMMLERRKKHQAAGQYVRSYYWRSRDKQEVDLVEDAANTLTAYESKWRKKESIPRGFTGSYPDVQAEFFTKDTYWQLM